MVREGKPIPGWLRALGAITGVADMALGLLATFWHPLFWLPALVLSVVVAYAFIVVRGTARELDERRR